MNLQQNPTISVERPDVRNGSETRLHGSRLVLARSIWGLLVVLTGSVFVANLPLYVAQLQTICVGVRCHTTQLTPSQAQALFQTFGLSPGLYAVYNVALTAIFALVCFTVGFVIFWRKSNDWMALLVALLVVVLGTAGVTNAVGGSHSTLQWSALILNFLTFGIFLLVFALFPDGRFAPYWSGWLVLGYLPAAAPHLFFPDVLSPDLLPLPPVPKILLLLAFFALNGGLLLAQVYRYRKVSNPVQRQQTKWVLFGGMAAVLEIIGVTLLPLLFPSLNQPGSLYPVLNPLVTTVFLLLVPLSIGFAILRYRLWDIDTLINRTLVYGLLSSILVALYAGLIIGLESLIGAITGQAGQQPVVLVVSTLAIATLFEPLRSRLQAVIDRSFYRRKYDAARTLEAFSTTLRNEVDLATLREHMAAVVQETMQPAHVSLWLRPPAHHGNHRVQLRTNSSAPLEDAARDER